MDTSLAGRGMTAEDRAIIVLSINYMLRAQRGDISQLQGVAGELFKSSPDILPRDYSLIYDTVKDFYAILLAEGERAGGSSAGSGVYGEVLQNCRILLEKLVEQCRLCGISVDNMVN